MSSPNNNKRTGSPIASSSTSKLIKTVDSSAKIITSAIENDLNDFVESLSKGEGCTPAWSCTNLLAIPTPILPPSPSLLGLPYSHPVPPLLSVTLTHFTGTTSLNYPSSTTSTTAEKDKGKGKLKSRLSFSLILPPTPYKSKITRLSFAPCGGHLLVYTTTDSILSTTKEGGEEDREEEGGNDLITIFEQKSGCINEWNLCWSEKLNSFGKVLTKGESKKVIDLRWLGEPRKWYPKRSDQSTDDSNNSNSTRPLFCAPHRSPPVVGSAFLLVLSSDELLFVHLPRSLPLLPMITVIPLSSSTSRTAQPTTPTNNSNTLNLSTAQVANGLAGGVGGNLRRSSIAVKDNSLSPPSTSLNGRKGSTTSSLGKHSLSKEDLKNLEFQTLNSNFGTTGGISKKRIVKAAMGMVRGRQSADWGQTTFLIATCSVPLSYPSSPSAYSSTTSENLIIPSSTLATLPELSTTTTTTKNSLLPPNSPDLDFDSIMDFSGLDEAFGDDPPLVTSTGNSIGKKRKITGEILEGGKRSGERKIDLCELVVELTAQGGPQLTIKPLSPLHLSDPTLLGSSIEGTLTHLDWLEDIELPSSFSSSASNVGSPPAAGAAAGGGGGEGEGSESSCDLHLLAVLAAPNEEGKFGSTLTTWALSNEPYTFSEAFSSLECKKLDLTRGNSEWSGRRLATQTINDLITFVVPRLGPVFSSFIVGKHTVGSEEGVEVCTKICAIDSSTLEPLDGFTPTSLPGHILYGRAQISPNRGLLCALPYPYDLKSQPGLVAVPLSRDGRLSKTLGDHLAIAIARQVDASDLVGRVLGLKDEAVTIEIVRNIRDTLQAMLSKARSFEGSTLQVELMGIVSTLYNSFPGLQLRGSIAFNVIELAACARVFQKCEKRERTMSENSYRCESDAVWPLIGHIKWYTDFCRELVKEVQESGPVASSPRLLLILQPYTRGLLIRISEYALALQAFLAGFPVNANVTVDLARSVLDDTINYNGLVVREWRKMLLEFGQSQMIELSGEKPQTRDLLIDFTIPPSFLPACTQIFQHLSNPNLIISLPPTPPTSPSASNNALDVIRKGKLPDTGSFRMCTRCGEKSEATEREGTETGRWQAYELGWEVRCMCGGLFYSFAIL